MFAAASSTSDESELRAISESDLVTEIDRKEGKLFLTFSVAAHDL